MCKGHLFHCWHYDGLRPTYKRRKNCAKGELDYIGVSQNKICCRCGKNKINVINSCDIPTVAISQILNRERGILE